MSKAPVIVEQQLAEAKRFWRNKQIRTALIVPWAEAYTGSFIMPVFAYFMQGLGLSATQMGQLRATQLALNATSAPFVGFLLDRHGPWMGIALPSSLCAIGCALRACASGFASLFTASIFSGLSGAKIDMAMAHLSRHSPPMRRTLAVSAAKVQIQCLTLLGMLSFTPLDALLRWLLPEAQFGMMRFRVHISLCTIGCGFGVLVLLLAKDAISYEAATDASSGEATRAVRAKTEDDEEALDPAERAPVCRKSTEGVGISVDPSPTQSPSVDLSPLSATARDDSQSSSRLAALCPCALSSGGMPPAVLLFAFIGLFFASMFRDLLRITWPLFIKQHFAWSEREYGLLLPLQQAFAFCLAATPWLHERLGSSASMGLLGGGSTLAYAIAFTMQRAIPGIKALHVVFALLADAANSAFELILVAIASIFVPPDAQGRLFALLAIMRYAGSFGGNLVGTYLYQLSAGWEDAPLIIGGGALPTTLLAVPALLNVAALVSALSVASAGLTAGQKGNKKLAGGSGSATDDELV